MGESGHYQLSRAHVGRGGKPDSKSREGTAGCPPEIGPGAKRPNGTRGRLATDAHTRSRVCLPTAPPRPRRAKHRRRRQHYRGRERNRILARARGAPIIGGRRLPRRRHTKGTSCRRRSGKHTRFSPAATDTLPTGGDIRRRHGPATTPMSKFLVTVRRLGDQQRDRRAPRWDDLRIGGGILLINERLEARSKRRQ